MIEHIINGHELTLHYGGDNSQKAIRQSLAQYHGNASLDEITDIVADLSDCKDSAICHGVLAEISAFIRIASVTNPRLRVAVISENADAMLDSEASLAFGSFHYPIRIFESGDNARDWLMKTPLRSRHATMLHA